ncbi:hypothetical protein ACWDMY_20200, partial [Streptomyces globisporus]
MDDDLPPDLVRLRTLETWAAHYLTRIRARIAAVERQQQEQPRQPTGTMTRSSSTRSPSTWRSCTSRIPTGS